jgi:hypothetical protein
MQSDQEKQCGITFELSTLNNQAQDSNRTNLMHFDVSETGGNF